MANSSLHKQQQFHRYLLRVLEVAVLFCFIAIITILFAFLMKYILPFVIGWIFAVLLIPAVRGLEKHGVSRIISVISVMGTFVLAVVSIMIALIVGIAREAAMLTSKSTLYFQHVNNWIIDKVTLGRVFYSKLPPDVAAKMKAALSDTLKQVEKWLQSFVSFLLTSVTHLPESLFIIVIALITTFFILVNRERMLRRFLSFLPPGWSSQFRGVLEAMTSAFVGTIRVQGLLMLLSAVLGVAGMWILHFPYAVILGVLFGIAGIVPILGSAILTIPWAIGALLLGDLSTAVKLLLLQTVVSIIRHLIEPKILADSVGLDILSTLFALYVGMQSFGMFGLFLGPIILIGVKSLFATHLFVDFLPYTSPDRQAAPGLSKDSVSSRPEASKEDSE